MLAAETSTAGVRRDAHPPPGPQGPAPPPLLSPALQHDARRGQISTSCERSNSSDADRGFFLFNRKRFTQELKYITNKTKDKMLQER